MKGKINIKNKKARYQYELLDKFVAGIVLTGTEIKSIRNSKASIVESFCQMKNDEVFVINMHIAEYKEGTYNNHKPKRERKLLLNKREIKKIKSKMKNVGITIVPTNLYISDNGYAKLVIYLAKGKKIHDKRETIKNREIERRIGVFK